MPIPDDVRQEAELALREFCEQHSTAAGSDQVRYIAEFEPSAAVLIAQRPGFMKPDELISTPLARFRYSQARNIWSLYWRDSSGKWQRVSNVPTDKSIRVLLKAVLEDALGVFWS